MIKAKKEQAARLMIEAAKFNEHVSAASHQIIINCVVLYWMVSYSIILQSWYSPYIQAIALRKQREEQEKEEEQRAADFLVAKVGKSQYLCFIYLR